MSIYSRQNPIVCRIALNTRDDPRGKMKTKVENITEQLKLRTMHIHYIGIYVV